MRQLCYTYMYENAFLNLFCEWLMHNLNSSLLWRLALNEINLIIFIEFALFEIHDRLNLFFDVNPSSMSLMFLMSTHLYLPTWSLVFILFDEACSMLYLWVLHGSDYEDPPHTLSLSTLLCLLSFDGIQMLIIHEILQFSVLRMQMVHGLCLPNLPRLLFHLFILLGTQILL